MPTSACGHLLLSLARDCAVRLPDRKSGTKEDRPFSSLTDMTSIASPERDIEMTTLPNGVRVITEAMPHVRSVSVGIWIDSGSRREIARAERHLPLHRAHALQGDHEPLGRRHRPLGGFHRRQSRRLHRQGTGLLQHQGARRASAAGLRRAGRPGAASRCSAKKTSRRKRASSWKRSRWTPTVPTIWSTRSSPPISGRTIRSASRFWARARPSSASTATWSASITARIYAPANLLITAAGNLHARAAWWSWCASVSNRSRPAQPLGRDAVPSTHARIALRNKKELEQVHLCLGVPSYPAAARGPLRLLRAEHAAGRRHEFAALPEHPRAAGPGLRGLLGAEPVPRHRLPVDLRRHVARIGAQGGGVDPEGVPRAQGEAASATKNCAAPRII